MASTAYRAATNNSTAAPIKDAVFNLKLTNKPSLSA